MLLIPCPHCGPRALAEFTYERTEDSVVALDAAPDAAMASLFTRANPRGPSWELWRHNYGCRAWMRIRRHTATQAIEAVEPVGVAHLQEAAR